MNPDHTSAMESSITGPNGETATLNGNVEGSNTHQPTRERTDPYVEQVQNVVTSDVRLLHPIAMRTYY